MKPESFIRCPRCRRWLPDTAFLTTAGVAYGSCTTCRESLRRRAAKRARALIRRAAAPYDWARDPETTP